MNEILKAVTMLVLPFGGALILAALLGRLARTTLMSVPRWLKVTVAGLVGALWPLVYFIVWQNIDVALREARGDTSEYMGPAVMLIYAWPIVALTIIGSFCIAYFAAAVRK